jgi:hypothetical protein
MLELALFVLLVSRIYQMCGHIHYLFNAPIKPGFQKTRAGHVLFTTYDGLTFTADALLLSANALFISLAVGHLAVAFMQIVAWDVYCRRFFDILIARSYYSDGLHALRRILLLAYDIAGQILSLSLLLTALRLPLLLPAIAIGGLGYALLTADFRLLRRTSSES